MSTIAIVGGTGPQGKGLGYRFARGGHDVILGSRSEERAIEAAAELDQRHIAGSVRGAANARAAEAADMVVLAIPFDGHDELVTELAPDLAGKIVISCVNPLGFDKRGPYGLDLGQDRRASRSRLSTEARRRLLPR
ncbi:NADPH-dependent F420 reductase [Nocardia salmonicida]|uniref:NADPH-dependent F420 reductase n=1 Tax=Nocardia salmonicida TaxID=53431 RepID=UPI0033E01CB3